MKERKGKERASLSLPLYLSFFFYPPYCLSVIRQVKELVVQKLFKDEDEDEDRYVVADGKKGKDLDRARERNQDIRGIDQETKESVLSQIGDQKRDTVVVADIADGGGRPGQEWLSVPMCDNPFHSPDRYDKVEKSILYYTILYFTILYYNIIYYTILYYTILY